MKIPFNILLPCLLCLVLSLLSGCGKRDSRVAAEHTRVDELIATHGKSVLICLLREEVFLAEKVGKSPDANLILKNLKQCIAKEADVNAKLDKDYMVLGVRFRATEETPLHVAAELGNVEVAKFLVSQGADANAKNKAGKTPLDLAKALKKDAVAEYLSSL